MAKTDIFKFTAQAEIRVGYVQDQGIFSYDGASDEQVGCFDEEGRIFRTTRFGKQELGYVTPAGEVHSHGLFEGGALGWLEEDGIVIQAGLILGEEEVGRVHGPQPDVAAAALLLYFLPKDAEMDRETDRRQ